MGRNGFGPKLPVTRDIRTCDLQKLRANLLLIRRLYGGGKSQSQLQILRVSGVFDILRKSFEEKFNKSNQVYK